MVKVLFLSFFCYVIMLICRLLNAVFWGEMPVIVGVFVCSPVIACSLFESIVFYTVLGFILDSLYPFLPFGFSLVFFMVFFCISKFLFPQELRAISAGKQGFEQIANFAYLSLLFAFSGRLVTSMRSIILIFLSQTLTFILSKPVFGWCEKVTTLCGSYTRIDPQL